MSSTLDSVAAFSDRAEQIGVDRWIVDKLVEKKFATFGRLAFAFPYSPQTADDSAFKRFLADVLGDALSDDQMATLRRLFFESHTMALTDVRLRSESSPDPSQATRKLPTAERVARQREQHKRLGGLIFDPSTIPANHLVDLYVEMVETGVLTYVKAENCCSRAQEVEAIKKDPAVSTDSSGLLKLSTKQGDQHCEANTELKLRAAWQRRNLAMDLAGLSTFEKAESWTQFLFTQLMKDQPKGFSRISIQQLVDCDKHLFILASHMTMGKLASAAGETKPMDAAFDRLRDSSEVLQYLTPLPATRVHEAPVATNVRPNKTAKTEKGAKGSGKSQSTKGASTSRVQVPEGCTSHDSDNKPLCFAYQQGRCKFKGPAGKRCARGYHKCYKQGCYRHKPFYLCNHTD
jgi:hypothetical protein